MTDAEFLDGMARRISIDGIDCTYSIDERDRLVALARAGITAARERDLLLLAPDNRLDGYREMGEKCAALEERIDQLRTRLTTVERERDELRAIAQEHEQCSKWDGTMGRGRWVPQKFARDLQATIREQKDLNDSLAFQLGGVKTELLIVRRLLRRFWHSTCAFEDQQVAEDVCSYLAGVPRTEVES